MTETVHEREAFLRLHWGVAHFFSFLFVAPVHVLCCKPKYRRNIIHNLIFVFFPYIFFLSLFLP